MHEPVKGLLHWSLKLVLLVYKIGVGSPGLQDWSWFSWFTRLELVSLTYKIGVGSPDLFNNYLFLIFIILQKYWDSYQRKMTDDFFVIVAVFSCFICLSDNILPPLANFEKEISNISVFLPKKDTLKITGHSL